MARPREQAGDLTLSTCSSNTEFETRLTLYRGVPIYNGTLGEVLAVSEEKSYKGTNCAALHAFM